MIYGLVAGVFAFLRQRRRDFLRVGRNFVTVDFHLALVADNDAAQAGTAVAVEFKANFNAVVEPHLHFGAWSCNARHAVVLNARLLFAVSAVGILAGILNRARFFQTNSGRTGEAGSDSHLHLVKGVSSPAGDAEAQPACVVVRPARPASLNFRQARAKFRLVCPDIPPVRAVLRVEIIFRVVVRERVRSDKVGNQNRFDFSNCAVGDLFARPLAQRKRALLRSHLNNLVELAGCVDHSSTFLNRQRHRLFHIDVHAHQHGLNSHPNALMCNSFNQNAVELLFLDHLAEIGIPGNVGETLGSVRQTGFENIAHAADFDIFRVAKIAVKEPATATALPDNPNANALAGRRFVRQTQRAGGNQYRNACQRRLQKRTS